MLEKRKYYSLLLSDGFAEINVDFPLGKYRDIACRIVYGEPAKDGLVLDRDVPEAIEEAYEKPWKWWFYPDRKHQPPKPDIADFDGWYAFNDKSKSVLAPLLEKCGTWVDISQGEDRYFVFARTISKRILAPLSECPHWFCSDRFPVTYVSEEFVRAYKLHSLTGLRFRPVDENFKPIFEPTPPVDVAHVIEQFVEGYVGLDAIEDVFDAVYDPVVTITKESLRGMKKVPEEIRTFFCAYRCLYELSYTGTDMLFNAMPNLLPCARDAYQTIGLIKQAGQLTRMLEMLQEAGVEVKKLNKPIHIEKNILDNVYKLWETEKYQDLDIDLDEIEDARHLMEYVVAHKQVFIDFCPKP